MSELISVVVPIYNTGKYLVECVEHILKQTYQNIEIILVVMVRRIILGKFVMLL